MKRISFSLLIICLLLTLTACNGSTSTGDNETSDTFSLNICVGPEPDSLDPTFYNNTESATILYHLYEGLCKWVDDGDGQAVLAGGQAASWETTEKDTVWTFHLRDNIYWSDGEAVTAGDFVYAWQRVVNNANKSDYSYLLDVVENAPAIANGELDASALGIVALDDRTLKITLTESCPYFDQICALPITFPLRQDVVAANDAWAVEAATYISNGPYTLSEWAHDSYLLTVKNDQYYGASLIGPTSLRFALMSNKEKIYAAYSGDELHFMEAPPENELEALAESAELRSVPQLGVYYVTFHTQTAPFDDVRVRQAFSLVINRTFIVDELCQQGETVADGFVPAGVYDAAGSAGDDFRTIGGSYYATDYRSYADNCIRARELLAEAGYPDGQNFPDVEYVYNSGDQHQAIATALRDMWSIELGVDVALSPQRWSVYLPVISSGNFALARGGWVEDYNDPIFFLEMWGENSTANSAAYRDWKYNYDLRRAKNSDDAVLRMEALHAAEDLLIEEDQVVAPIYFYAHTYLLKDNLDGLFSSSLGSFFFSYASEKEE